MKKLLIVIDMQNDFIDGSLGSNEAKQIVPNVVKLIQNWKKKDIIWFTKDTHYENSIQNLNYDLTLEGKMYPIKHCIENSSGWHINEYIRDEIDAFKGSKKCFCKNTFGSIEMVNRIELLTYFGSEDEIHLCGLVTNICVLHNFCLLRAKFPNLKIFIHENCCAGTSKNAHEAALQMMKDGGAIII